MIRTIVKIAKLNASTHKKLDAFLRQQTELYNAGLQERMDCYKKTGETITLYEQYGSLTEIRRDSDFSQYAVQPQRTALRTLDKGMKSLASPGASENVREAYVAGLPGQDTERYAAAGV
ncbi:MAG: hypothetical protein F4Z15_03835 [Gammaproteobacteria bacterium]|nr:hypothetical protein [Gammaproteobacteria bacterium]MYD75424.1 hypothetical protein [Gammaproteobacteria bacterium]